MSQSSPGISRSVAEAIADRAADRALREAKNYVDQKVTAIMRDIDQMSRELQSSIETQTAAIIAGVGATTTAIISTKSEISDTRNQISDKLTLQLKSELQLELGRKLNVARSASTKFQQFFQEIKSRFDRTVQGVFINRNEYDIRFNQIFEEYENKIRSIGDHIFQIRDEIRLVEASNSESLETIHGLPMEVDLYRLTLRSEELDQTMQLLEVSRLQEIKTSLSKLAETCEALSFPNLYDDHQELGMEAQLLTSESGSADLLVGADVQRAPGASMRLETSITSNPANYITENLSEIIQERLAPKAKRDLNEMEYKELQEAIQTLSEDGIISPDDAAFAEAVINAKSIQTYV